MQRVSIEQFTEIVSAMSITATQNSGFAVTHFGISPAGDKVIATSDMNGHCYLMMGPA
ncbi:hypothetical protein QF000_004977 [Paraburkholderia atlantica]|uniref:hypothetical protein n=1 Tax=Paraburkholderia atlantica TaxID=2654982 RepID=UPI003D2150F3